MIGTVRLDARRVAAAILALWSLSTGVRAEDAANEDAARHVIIHADDAGMSHSVNVATIEAMEKGLVSSASIMVPCPWFLEFAKYAKEHPERCYGVHLTLNSEWDHYRWGPVASRDLVPTLVDPDGYLWDNVAQVAAHAKANEVRIELRAQIDRARQFGVPLSHIDTHMGALVSRPDLLDVFVELGEEYDLPILFMRRLSDDAKRAYPTLAEKHDTILRRLEARGVPMLDELLQFYGGDTHEARREEYLSALRQLKPGVTELIIHCGFDNEELRAITNSASRRDGDRRVFCEDDVRRLLADQGVKIVSWKQLREQGRGPAGR
ncbi:MAG: ChbG/HpnK family deacetylase [Planctomycetes bacterium]|nr:ChbG/HpnK family deacetylase [Planctomycetota bacterium]